MSREPPGRSTAKTRCPPHQRQPGKPEPFGRSPPGFSPLGINARRKACSLGGLPSGTPDCPSLPSGVFLINTAGSSFRARYVPFGSLFREPLGTISNMHQRPRSVNRNRTETAPCGGFLFAVFSTACIRISVKALCKKRESDNLFFLFPPDRPPCPPPDAWTLRPPARCRRQTPLPPALTAPHPCRRTGAPAPRGAAGRSRRPVRSLCCRRRPGVAGRDPEHLCSAPGRPPAACGRSACGPVVERGLEQQPEACPLSRWITGSARLPRLPGQVYGLKGMRKGISRGGNGRPRAGKASVQRRRAFSLPTIFSKRARCSGVSTRRMRFLPSARKSSIWPCRFW